MAWINLLGKKGGQKENTQPTFFFFGPFLPGTPWNKGPVRRGKRSPESNASIHLFLMGRLSSDRTTNDTFRHKRKKKHCIITYYVVVVLYIRRFKEEDDYSGRSTPSGGIITHYSPFSGVYFDFLSRFRVSRMALLERERKERRVGGGGGEQVFPRRGQFILFLFPLPLWFFETTRDLVGDDQRAGWQDGSIDGLDGRVTGPLECLV